LREKWGKNNSPEPEEEGDICRGGGDDSKRGHGEKNTKTQDGTLGKAQSGRSSQGEKRGGSGEEERSIPEGGGGKGKEEKVITERKNKKKPGIKKRRRKLSNPLRKIERGGTSGQGGGHKVPSKREGGNPLTIPELRKPTQE